MTTSSIPNDTEQGDSGESPRPSLLERIFGNQFVLLGLLLTLLGWVALTRIWLFVLIVAIVASVFLHEMGHFLMAKRNGMKVTEFFIGFGPRVWSFRRGETEIRELCFVARQWWAGGSRGSGWRGRPSLPSS